MIETKSWSTVQALFIHMAEANADKTSTLPYFLLLKQMNQKWILPNE